MSDCARLRRHQYQTGLTLVELMVALTLGLLLAMAATALLLSCKLSYTSLDDTARLQDTGRYALELITRATHQASYTNWDKDDAPIVTSAMHSADIRGIDSHSLTSTTPDIQLPLSKSINGSDVLALRFFGSGSGMTGDGTIQNCAGFGVPAIQSIDAAEEGRGWSIFYIAAGASGEPELRCKYQGKSAWISEAIALGVESFQVLYGIDTDDDGLPNQYVSASAVDQLDQRLNITGANAEEKEIALHKKTNWKKVVAIKVAMLVRGAEKSRSDALSNTYELFGSEYSRENTADSGVVIKEENLESSTRNRARKVFQQTIMLRNHRIGGA